jgi:hypothetical protein
VSRGSSWGISMGMRYFRLIDEDDSRRRSPPEINDPFLLYCTETLRAVSLSKGWKMIIDVLDRDNGELIH